MGQCWPLRLFTIVSIKEFNFTKSQYEKCQSSLWHWDSNSQPLEHESPPLTTKPGLPPKPSFVKAKLFLMRFSSINSNRLAARSNLRELQRKILVVHSTRLLVGLDYDFVSKYFQSSSSDIFS